MFFSILHDPKNSQQNIQGKSSKAGINNSSLENKSLVCKDFEYVNQESYFAALEKGLLKNTKGEIHALVQNRILQLVVWTVSGIDCRRREFQKQLPTLPPSQEDQILMQIMKQPGESELAGVLEGKLIHFLVM